MKEVKAVVVHWDGGEVKSIPALKEWMVNYTDHMYHRFVKSNQVDYGRSTTKRCTAVGANIYTPEAVNFFGKYCPDWDHRVKKHNNSPNNCTVNICILHDFEDGGYSETTMLTAARLCGDMLNYYDLDIKALWTHSMICGTAYKHCPKEFIEKPEQWEIFKDMVKHYM